MPACVVALFGADGAVAAALARALKSTLAAAGQRVVIAPVVSAETVQDADIVIMPTAELPRCVDPAHTLTLLLSNDADDAHLRSALDTAGIAYSVATGTLQQQTDAALAAVARAQSSPDPAVRWQWVCERCGDGGCERHLLPRP